MLAFNKTIYAVILLIIGLGVILACGSGNGINNDITASTPPEELRTVSGTLTEAESEALSLREASYKLQDVDRIKAIDEAGDTYISSVLNGEFSLNLPVKKKYTIGFMHHNEFVAALSYNSTPWFELQEDPDRGLQLGHIRVNIVQQIAEPENDPWEGHPISGASPFEDTNGDNIPDVFMKPDDLAFDVSTLADGALNVSYEFEVSITGGRSPYMWTVASGALPSGLQIDSSNGIISGTPTAYGTSSFTIKVTDAKKVSVSQDFAITIGGLYISTSELADGTYGSAYSATLAVAGDAGPYTWSLKSGLLPSGLQLDSATGVISGTPDAIESQTFVVSVTNGAWTASREFSINANSSGAISIVTTTLPTAAKGFAYSTTLSVAGDPGPYTWSVTSGTLPTGLSLGTSTGTISGTATALEEKTFTIRVSNGVWADSQEFTLKVNGIAISTTNPLPDGEVNVLYSKVLEVVGSAGPYTWSLNSGSLPNGLSLNTSTGEISGTPTTLGHGTSTFTVGLDNGTFQTSMEFNLTIKGVWITTSSNLPDGTYGIPYSTTISVSGDTGPYTWSVLGGILPGGLTLNASTGLISGTPTAIEQQIFTIKVTAGIYLDTFEFTLKSNSTGAITITTSNILPDSIVGNAYSQSLAVTGDPGPYIWSVTAGSLPSGLALNTNTGVIYGTPATGEVQTFTINVTNGSLSDNRQFSLLASLNKWTEIIPDTCGLPSSRCQHKAVEINGKMYVFGGSGTTSFLNDLWEYDPIANSWIEKTPVGAAPIARKDYSAISINSKMYVFGGYIGVANFRNDLWVYDPIANTWTELSPAGGPPSARYVHTAVAINGKMYVFGGNDGVYKNDLWVYDPALNTWTQLAPIGGPPAARGNHCAANVNDKMYIFSGAGAGTNDLWEYAPVGNAWVQLAPTGTLPPYLTNVSASTVNGKMYIYGSFDLWEFDQVGNTWSKIVPAGESIYSRIGYSMAVISNEIYIFGGATLEYRNDLWKYDKNSNAWTQLAQMRGIPSPRDRACSMAVDGKIYIYRGHVGDPNNMWVYDCDLNFWAETFPTGGPPDGTLVPAVQINGKMYIFGGSAGGTDLWAYTPASKTWTLITPTGAPPSPRYKYCSTTIGSKMYVFGGNDFGSLKNDLWVYDAVANTWAQLTPTGTPPSGRVDLDATSIGSKMYIFGGSGGGIKNDLWEYDSVANTWKELSPISNIPSVRYVHCIETINGKIYLFGGNDGVNKNDLWRYDPVANVWSELTPVGGPPSVRNNHSMLTMNNKIYIFGGSDSGSDKNDLWEYVP